MTIKAVLDTCVLYPFYLRDFLLTASSKKFSLFLPFWSDRILKELVKHHPKRESHPEQVDKLVGAISKHFPSSCVNLVNSDLESVRTLSLPDKEDAHVIAAAIKAKAQIIVTENIKDFPSEVLGKFQITAMTSGQFSKKLVSIYGKESIDEVFSSMASRYKNPKRTVDFVSKCLRKYQIDY